jgi:hypothetical protein
MALISSLAIFFVLAVPVRSHYSRKGLASVPPDNVSKNIAVTERRGSLKS